MDYDLHPRLKRFFEAAPGDERSFGYFAYDFAKYVFEFLRNVIVVGVLKYFADKSGNTVLLVLYHVASLALFFFILSFIVTWNLRILSIFIKRPVAQVFDAILNLALASLIVLYALGFISEVAKQIASLQIR